MSLKHGIRAAAFCAVAACCVFVFADDPGDLFPDVPYTDKVAAPVTHQEKIFTTPAPAAPSHVDQSPKPPKPAHAPTKPKPKPADTQRATPEATQPAGPIWESYTQAISTPFLSPEDHEIFDRDYAPAIQTALKGTPQERLDTSALVSDAAAKVQSPNLQRYLYLHSLGLAIRGGAPLAEREKEARLVLPLLNDRTLAVAQSRADCLDSLAASTSDVSDGLLTMVGHAYATLAELQAQAGYADEASASFAAARKWLMTGTVHNPLLTSQLAASKDWVTRATMAAKLLPGLRAKLATDPKDAYANTQLALVELGLHGNLAAALPYAAYSDNAELHKLPALVQGLDLDEMRCDSATDATASLPIISALADIAKSVEGPDRFLIANLAKHRLESISALLPPLSTHQLDASLRKISDKILAQADPFETLADIPPPAASQPAAAAAAIAHAGLNFTSVAQVFSNCPTMPERTTAAQNAELAAAANTWLQQNVLGAHLATPAEVLQKRGEVKSGETSYIALRLCLPHLVLGGVAYIVYVEAHCDPKMADAISNLQAGQVLTVGGTVVSATIKLPDPNSRMYMNTSPLITITLSDVGK